MNYIIYVNINIDYSRLLHLLVMLLVEMYRIITERDYYTLVLGTKLEALLISCKEVQCMAKGRDLS